MYFATNNRSAMRSLVVIFCVFTLNIAVVHMKAPPKCAALNEYCQNHWDCCSNSCLSYMYRCTRNYAIYPYTFFGDSQPPAQATLDDILELNFGAVARPQMQQHMQMAAIPQQHHPNMLSVDTRIGSSGIAATTTTTPTATKAPPQTPTKTITEEIRISTSTTPTTTIPEETTMPEETTTIEITTTAAIESNAIAKGQRATPASAIANSVRNVNSRGSVVQAVVDGAKTKTSCTEPLGECNRNEDCCNNDCYQLLHLCIPAPKNG